MKAVVYTEYGSPDVLRMEEIEGPVPKDDEVLVKVYAASVNSADWHYLRGDPSFMRLGIGLLKPKQHILGSDIAGRVEAVGSSVRQFKPGNEVFGDISSCGMGGFAEYACAHEDALMLKPSGVSFEEAAAVPMASVTALHGLRDQGGIQAGQKVLINGASGGVGMFAVQIAKSFGAEVTGVCSTGKLDMLSSIGADHVIDYTRENFTKNGQSYDLILAANGYHSIWAYRRSLTPRGVYVESGGSMRQIIEAAFLGPLVSMCGSKKMGTFISKSNKEHLAFVTGLLESGKVKPVIDACYPLSETAEAFRYFEDEHPRGKVVITV